jgi:DNA-binding transcriptional LysR family regulator
VDVAIRGGVVRAQSLMARQLVKSTLVAVASPDYLSRRGAPTSPEALSEHACLRGFSQGARPITRWPLWGRGHVDVDGPLVTNDMVALLDAARAGLGVALLPRPLVARDLGSGALTAVLEDQVGMRVSLSLVWVERELIEPKVRAFIDLAVEWADAGRIEALSASRHQRGL